MKRIALLVAALALFALVSAGSESYEKAKVWLVSQGPTIGSDLSFWDGLEGTTVDLRPWGGTAADASGVFTLAADEKNLYLLARVNDASPQENKKSASSYWQKTSIEVYFGTNVKEHFSYVPGDSQICLWGKDKADPAAVGAGKGGAAIKATNYQAHIIWGEKSYTIEAAFPYSTLGIKPLKAGQPVRCEFRINAAKPGADRSIIVNWRTDGDAAYKQPSLWSDGIVVAK